MTSLQTFHGASNVAGNTKVKAGDVVQIHSDKKRLRWKLAVVESLIRGNDNCVRAVNLRTANGLTNRPITKLYPLKVLAESEPKVSEEESVEHEDRLPQPVQRSKRALAVEARHNIMDWTTDETYTDAELARVSVLTRNLSRQQCTCNTDNERKLSRQGESAIS